MKEELTNLIGRNVRITNDKERNIFLQICEKEGITWFFGSHRPTTSYFPTQNYPYLISYIQSDDKDKGGLISLINHSIDYLTFDYFMYEYNKLNNKVNVHGSLLKEKIKNLKTGVLITNDCERDEFLRFCQEAELKWGRGEAATEYKPKEKYPYVLLCTSSEDDETALRYSLVNLDSAISFDEFRIRLTNHQYEIVISCYDGKTTTARMMVDGKEVRSSKTRRLESDKFNWRIGAELAAERLWDKKPKVEVKIFNIGDKVRVGGKSSPSHLRGKTGIVKKFSCGNANSIGVEFDDPDFQGHNLNGTIESTRGWWVGRAYLRKVK